MRFQFPAAAITLVVLAGLLGPLDSPVASAQESKKASSRVDRDFDKWLTAEKSPTARALAAQFITATGGSPDEYEKVLEGLVSKLGAKKSTGGARERAELLRTNVFGAAGFRSSADLSSLENLLPQRIVARKTGYCIGLTLILLDLCERLGWDARAVSAPRHTFLRLEGKTPVNLETTLAGALHDDDWYRQRFSIGQRPGPLRALTIRELGGHLLNNVAYALLEGGSTSEARGLIDRSLKLDPKGVEAITNAGVCAARSGDFERALESFGRTLELWPGDPVTRLNRVNALLPLGRNDEAIQELSSLLETYPTLPSLTARAREIRDQFDVHHRWNERQQLTSALIEQEVATRGALPGLEGVYHRGTKLNDPKMRRIDRTLEFQWGRGSPGRGIPQNHWSARWTGWIEIPAEDEYTFLVSCSDGVRLHIDDRLVIDAWRTIGDNFPKGTVSLLPGRHEIRVDYYEAIDVAGILVMLVSEKESEQYELAPMFSHPGPVKDDTLKTSRTKRNTAGGSTE